MFNKTSIKYLIVIVYVLFYACDSGNSNGNDESKEEITVSSISIQTNNNWVYLDNNIELSATVKYSDLSSKEENVNWSVNSRGSLSVTNGVSTVLKAISKGDIKVTVELNNVTSSITIEAREIVPPFSGTVFVDPDIIKGTDTSTFQELVYTGQGLRTVFDRRTADWVTINAFLFDVTFDDGLTLEAQINPEFQTKALAEVEANKFALEVGRLPKVLRKDVNALWVHKGVEPFGGGNNSILIHTGQSILYENDGILEEVLVHEAAHTSLDAEHANSSGWINSQKADINFISTYARDNPFREDIAESFLLYLAVKYRADRISEDLKNTIQNTIPNRIDYFDSLALDLNPIN